jgi:acetyl-CoA carboxylase biotin carboxyl carrier protein
VKIDLEQIRDLLKAVSQTDITELTIESGDEKITVRKSTASVVAHAPVAAAIEAPVAVQHAAPRLVTATVAAEQPKPNNNKAQDNGEAPNGLISITSPMVGTFYRSPAPTSPSFVEVGDRVNVGQTVCIIEAMKLMNDLPSEVSGKIVKVLVENGTTVEFGQQLFLLDPNG